MVIRAADHVAQQLVRNTTRNTEDRANESGRLWFYSHAGANKRHIL